MKRILAIPLLIFAVTLHAFSQTPDEKAPPSLKANKGKSAQAAQNQLPAGWAAAGSRPRDYEMGLDTTEKHGGKAGAFIRLRRYLFRSDGFGALEQIIKADNYRGRRVRLSAYVKTEEVEEYAGVWMRVNGEGRILGYDNMSNRPITGTTDWQKYEVVLDVPETSTTIAFGILLRGAGRAWADDFRLESVGQEVPTTNRLPPGGIEQKAGPVKDYPREPVNLDFENIPALQAPGP